MGKACPPPIYNLGGNVSSLSRLQGRKTGGQGNSTAMLLTIRLHPSSPSSPPPRAASHFVTPLLPQHAHANLAAPRITQLDKLVAVLLLNAQDCVPVALRPGNTHSTKAVRHTGTSHNG